MHEISIFIVKNNEILPLIPSYPNYFSRIFIAFAQDKICLPETSFGSLRKMRLKALFPANNFYAWSSSSIFIKVDFTNSLMLIHLE